jgi:hypothetical protein
MDACEPTTGCSNTPVDCSDGDECTTDACNEATGECEQVQVSPLPDPLPTTCARKIAFVTSTSHNGNLGGLAGADATCNELATEAGLPGTYLAWLGVTLPEPMGPAARFNHSTVPYVRVDGRVIASDWDDLTDGELDVPINVTELGTTFDNGREEVWTAVDTMGNHEGNVCHQWTNMDFINGQTGSASERDQRWTTFGRRQCGGFFQGVGPNFFLPSFYCFQQ